MTMDILTQRVLAGGKNLGGGILKVDSFVNHQVDPIMTSASNPLRRLSGSEDNFARRMMLTNYLSCYRHSKGKFDLGMLK